MIDEKKMALYSKMLMAIALILGLSACGEQKVAEPVAPAPLMSNTQLSETNNDVAEPKTKKVKKADTTQNNVQPNFQPYLTLVNINTASESELISALKGTGVGKVKVQSIIAYREQHGGFKSIEELNEVKGIGDKTMEKVRPRVTISN